MTFKESRIQIKDKLTPADMELLVSVMNYYQIYGLHLFWDTIEFFLTKNIYFRSKYSMWVYKQSDKFPPVCMYVCMRVC